MTFLQKGKRSSQSKVCEWCGKLLRSYQKRFCSNSHKARSQYASDSEREARKQKAYQEKTVEQIDDPADIFIYGLLDPRNHLIYYIGQSHSPHKRFAKHVFDARCSYGDNPLYIWMTDLLENSFGPIMILLQIVSKERAWFAEKEWIQLGLEHKWPLLNRNGRS